MTCSKCLGVLPRLNSYRKTPLCNNCAHASIIYSCTTNHYYIYYLTLNKVVVYVGFTANPMQRLRSHTINKKFDFMVLKFSFSCEFEAFECERKQIKKLKPALNKANGIHLRPASGVRRIPISEKIKKRESEKKAAEKVVLATISSQLEHTVTACKSLGLPLWYAFTTLLDKKE
jgi:predicted GIY-YIG superfamily endonuclease